MKKAAKIISLLLALIMVFSLTTMAMAEDAAVTLGTASRNGVSLHLGTPSAYADGLMPSYDDITKETGETGNFQRLPIAGSGTSIVNPRFYAVPKTGSVKLSKDGVIGDLSFSLDSWDGYPYYGATCLQFNFTALAEGSVNVTLTYYYNYNQSGLIGGTSWYKETATFTVNVPGSGAEPEQPEQPELTDVSVSSNIKEGKLLFLNDTFTVTAEANTAADIDLSITDNSGKELLGDVFTVTDEAVSEDGAATVYTLAVTRISGGYQKLNIAATATKGEKAVTSDPLSFGVNPRNRIHVTVASKATGVPVTDASVQLMHKYPQWNACPALKYDAENGEYVMKNMWDLSNQDFSSLNITIGGKTYSVSKTRDGRDLLSVIREGKEEIYVDFVVVDPITVTITVDGKLAAEHEFEGNDGDVLDFSKLYWAVMSEIQKAGKIANVSIAYDNGATAAVFGKCTKVTITISTIDSGSITVKGDDFPWESGEKITVKGDDFVWDTDESITVKGDDFTWDTDDDITVKGDDFTWG